MQYVSVLFVVFFFVLLCGAQENVPTVQPFGRDGSVGDPDAESDRQLQEHNAKVEAQQRKEREAVSMERVEAHKKHLEAHLKEEPLRHPVVTESTRKILKVHLSKFEDTPASPFRIFLVSLILGLPFVMILAWYKLR